MIQKLLTQLFRKVRKKDSHAIHWLLILSMMASSVFGVHLKNSPAQFASILDVPSHPVFDGTVYPVQQIPDWTRITSEERDYHFGQLSPDLFLDEVPVYDNEAFTYPSSSLKWGDASDNVIRNTKLTYTVPYGGKYTFGDEGIMGGGAHPGVDIVGLSGTPLFNIANGIVHKVGYDSGWGYYVVVKHENVPHPRLLSQKTDLYCGYTHLDFPAFAYEGEVVYKGQVIGEMGNNGTSTNPHLHFQCDLPSADYHLFWPFTNGQAAAAGYSFWEAVNNGLGVDEMLRHTVDPMEFVQRHLSTERPVVATYVEAETVLTPSSDTDADDSELEDFTPEETVSPEPSEQDDGLFDDSDILPKGEEEDVYVEVPLGTSTSTAVDFYDVSTDMPDMMLSGSTKQIIIQVLDPLGEPIEKPSFEGQLELSLSDGDVGNLSRRSLKASDFDNRGRVALELYAARDGEARIEYTIDDLEFFSQSFVVVTDIEPFAKFGVENETGTFIRGQAEEIMIRALDLEGRPTPRFDRGGEIELRFKEGYGEFSKNKLTNLDFAQGVARVEFTSLSEEAVVIEAVYGNKVYESEPIEPYLYTDLRPGDEYYEAIAFLSERGVVSGYPNGSFGPDRPVNRVESLKMTFSALDSKLVNQAPEFPDTEAKEWYAPYVASAVVSGVVRGYPDGFFRPTQQVNQVEFAKILLNMAGVSVDPVVSQSPYFDVNPLAWYAPHVSYIKEKDLFPVEGNYFNPGKPMTRGEVAEAIYRLLISE